jgi:hypothetical protein
MIDVEHLSRDAADGKRDEIVATIREAWCEVEPTKTDGRVPPANAQTPPSSGPTNCRTQLPRHSTHHNPTHNPDMADRLQKKGGGGRCRALFVILIPRGILLRRLPIEPVLAYHWGRSFDSGSMLTQARLICLTAQMCLTPAKTNATAIPCSMLSPRGPRGQELAKSTGISTACSQMPTERSPARARVSLHNLRGKEGGGTADRVRKKGVGSM